MKRRQGSAGERSGCLKLRGSRRTMERAQGKRYNEEG